MVSTLYNNPAPLAAPAPRKKPFIYNPFRRNEQKPSAVNPTSVLPGEGESSSATITANVGAGVSTTTECSPRDYSPAIKPTGRRYGARKTSKSSPGISYPSDVRHVFHVPCNLVFESNNELYREHSVPLLNFSLIFDVKIELFIVVIVRFCLQLPFTGATFLREVTIPS